MYRAWPIFGWAFLLLFRRFSVNNTYDYHTPLTYWVPHRYRESEWRDRAYPRGQLAQWLCGRGYDGAYSTCRARYYHSHEHRCYLYLSCPLWSLRSIHTHADIWRDSFCRLSSRAKSSVFRFAADSSFTKELTETYTYPPIYPQIPRVTDTWVSPICRDTFSLEPSYPPP